MPNKDLSAKQQYHQRYYQENKEKSRLRDKKRRATDSYKEYRKRWLESDKGIQYTHDYARSQKYKECRRRWEQSDRGKEWRQSWQESNKKRRHDIRQDRFKNDINYRLIASIRGRVAHAIKSQQSTKSRKTIALLGCSIEQARQHIENQFQDGMTWENYGYRTWHIDHIIPLSSFDLTSEEEQRKAFHYTNLQPLSARENMKKGSKV